MGMSEYLADLVLRPSYEQIVQSIKHQGVQEILRHAWADEQRLGQELEVLEENEDLNPEAKEDLAEEKRREHLDRAADLAREPYKIEGEAEEDISRLLSTLSEHEQLDRRHCQEMRLGGAEPPNEPLSYTVEPWLLTRLGGWVRENPSHQGFVAKDLGDLDGLAVAPKQD
jgi:hypothetical protein